MRAITLRVSGDASKLQRALYEITLRCNQRTRTDVYDAPRRNLPIAADGGLRDVERFIDEVLDPGLHRRRALRWADRREQGERHLLRRDARVEPTKRAHDRALRVGHGALGGGDMSMAANAWRRAGRRHAAGPAPTLY